MITQSVEKIGAMSCNPQLAVQQKDKEEIDALGGQMAKAIDATGIVQSSTERKAQLSGRQERRRTWTFTADT